MKWIKKHRKLLLLVFLFLCAMGFLCFLLYQPFMDVLANIHGIKRVVHSHTVSGRVIMILLMVLQVIFVFIPGEVIEIMAGVLYGPWEGLILCLLGVCIGSYIIYVLIKKFGVSFVEHFVGKEELDELHFLQNHTYIPFLLFVIYLIPGTPKDIITYAIPFTSLRFSHFLCITTFARIPSILTSTICGNALGLKQYGLSIGVFIVTSFVSLAGLFLYKRYIHKNL